MDRRNFLRWGGMGTVGMFIGSQLEAKVLDNARKNPKIKPIAGSWFEFQHMNKGEGLYWNPALKNFTTTQWKEKVREIKGVGMEYLVLMGIAAFGKAFYPTSLAPKFGLACDDPLEAVLSAADEEGIKFFISNDFWGDANNAEKMMKDPEIRKVRAKAMEEVAERYSHHTSFYGWYFPNEAYLHPYLDEFFIDYVNECAGLAKKLTPNCVNLVAPYNIKAEKSDKNYINQLERMNIEIVAYQDGIGVNSTKLGEPAKYFEHLHEAHQKAGRSRIWADMELFYFEDKTKGNLIPADFGTRILRQMEDLSPFVEKILCYQYIGIMNKPDSKAFAGHKDSVKLYQQYKHWLDHYKK